jgi:ferrous iron transport protein A
MNVAAQLNCNLRRKRFGNNGPPVETAGIPLSSLRPGAAGVVLGFAEVEDYGARMMALGLIPGQTVKVINGAKRQSYILQINESRIMIDWRTLEKIYVAPVTGSQKGGRMGWWNV